MTLPGNHPTRNRRATLEHRIGVHFTPVLAKHTKSFNLIDTLAVGVDRIRRNFEPLQRQVELWRKIVPLENLEVFEWRRIYLLCYFSSD